MKMPWSGLRNRIETLEKAIQVKAFDYSIYNLWANPTIGTDVHALQNDVKQLRADFELLCTSLKLCKDIPPSVTKYRPCRKKKA